MEKFVPKPKEIDVNSDTQSKEDEGGLFSLGFEEKAQEEVSREKDINLFVEPYSLLHDSEEIYDWYFKAMQMRDREPLEEERFIYHHFEGGNYEESKAFGCEKNGYILGSDIEGVFVPTHFAPRTLRGGYRLMKDLLNQEEPVALFITEDLVNTIEKMKGWKKIGIGFNYEFRGDQVKKYLVVNKLSAVTKLGVNQLGKFVGKKSHLLERRLKALVKASSSLPSKKSYYSGDYNNEVYVSR